MRSALNNKSRVLYALQCVWERVLCGVVVRNVRDRFRPGMGDRTPPPPLSLHSPLSLNHTRGEPRISVLIDYNVFYWFMSLCVHQILLEIYLNSIVLFVCNLMPKCVIYRLFFNVLLMFVVMASLELVLLLVGVKVVILFFCFVFSFLSMCWREMMCVCLC